MRLLPALLALILALLAPAALAGAQAERSYTYAHVAVDMRLRPDGELLVTEQYTYRFTGGPFRKALRGIALDRLDGVSDIALLEGSTPYQLVTSPNQPGTFTVEQLADEVLITWFYPPATDQTRTFTLRYTVAGAVRSDPEADEVWWVALFPDRDVPVERSTVTMHFPVGSDLRAQDIFLPAASADLTVEPRTLTLRRNTPLPPGEALELRVALDPDLVVAPKPDWQLDAESPVPTPAPASNYARSEDTDPASMLRCLVIVMVVVAALGSMAWRAMNGEEIFASSGDGWSSSRRSSSSSFRSSSGSRSSSSSSRSSSSRSGGSTRGGSGGGRGGAG